MIKLMKYLKKSAGFIVLIIGLLFLQAYCDLSLPDYTSKIINVGIQQGGIEDGVPEKIRVSTMEKLQIFMDEETQESVLQAYDQEDDIYVLKKHMSETERENLNDTLSKPMMMY
jgi:ATP-binding cassette subfamily B protein